MILFEIAEAVLDAEAKIGELTSKMEKATANQYTVQKDSGVSKQKQLDSIGISKMQASRFETLARHPETVEQAKEDARAELALKLKPVIAEKAKENVLAAQNNSAASAHQKSDKQINTNKELAKAAGVSHDTIHKVEKIQKEAPEETKEALRRGERSRFYWSLRTYMGCIIMRSGISASYTVKLSHEAHRHAERRMICINEKSRNHFAW